MSVWVGIRGKAGKTPMLCKPWQSSRWWDIEKWKRRLGDADSGSRAGCSECMKVILRSCYAATKTECARIIFQSRNLNRAELKPHYSTFPEHVGHSDEELDGWSLQKTMSAHLFVTVWLIHKDAEHKHNNYILQRSVTERLMVSTDTHVCKDNPRCLSDSKPLTPSAFSWLAS